jgi:polyphosphate kinase
MQDQQRAWEALLRRCAIADIRVLAADESGRGRSAWLEQDFLNRCSGADPARERPGASVSVLSPQAAHARVRDDARGDSQRRTGTAMLPAMLRRFVRLPGHPARYVAMEQVLRRYFPLVFPGFRRLGDGAFR